MNKEQFQQYLQAENITLTKQQEAQLETYYETLVEWNERMNLTAITEKEEVYLKHFYDSISAAFAFDFTKVTKVCDVGAGAGFPSIPLKIVFPHLHLTIVDSLQKRITFLEHLAKELELTNVHFYHDRAETFAKLASMREQFEVVTARAVARLSVLSELCLPLVQIGGHFLALKAAAAEEEIEKATYGIGLFGGKITGVKNFHLPLDDSERNIITIEKIKYTPKKYPRKPGTPNKLPIEK